MKVIINVSKGSSYSKYNGLTFEVKELLRTIIAVSIDNQTVDFRLDEVIVIDIEEETNSCMDSEFNREFSPNVLTSNLKTLQNYISKNNITINQ